MARSKKYFPHSIEDVMFITFPDDIEFEEFMDNRVHNWNVPSSVTCIIRSQNKKTGKVQEFSYQRTHAARKKVQELCKDKDNEIILCDDDVIVKCDPNDYPGLLAED